MRLPILLTFALAAALLMRPAVAADSALDSLVLATVYGESITRLQLVDRLLDQQGDDAVQRMVSRALVTQAAKKDGLVVGDDELEKNLVQIHAKFKSEAAYQAFLKRNNLTEKQHREEVRFTMLLQKIVQKEMPVSDADLQQYDIRMAVASDKPTAEKWIQELQSGLDFAKLAMERSADPAGRQAGGKMAPFLKIEMLDVAKAIDEQKVAPGAFTKKPVALPNDRWAVVKLEGLLPGTQVSPAERDRFVTLVTRYNMDEWLTAARKKAEVQRKPLTEAVIATVNGEAVTRKALITRLLEYQGEKTLSELISRALLLQAAKKAGVSVNEAEADKELADFKARLKKPDEYQSFLTSNNLSEKALREELRFTALLEKIVLKESPVTDDDLMLWDVRMIEAPDRATAEKWIKELDGGTDFEQMARDRTISQQGRQTGGHLKPFLKIELLDVWRALDAQKIKVGSYTKKPSILTDGSWAILKLEAKNPADAKDRAQLTEAVTQYRVNQWMNQAVTAAEKDGKLSRPVTIAALLQRGAD